MAKFIYTALKNNNQLVKGEIEASSQREAREKIRRLGFLPTKVYTESSNQPELSENLYQEQASPQNKRIKRLSLQEKIMFTSELQVLLSSGIPILEVLQTVGKNTPKEKLKIVCRSLSECIMSGMTFAQALSSLYSKVFGLVYTGLVKTGEDAGELDVTLDRMLVLLRKQERIRDKVVSASIYPAILVAIMTGVLIIFSKFVFPSFIGMITLNGGDIPFYSQMLIDVCQFINQFWWFVLIGLGTFCGGLVSLFKNPQIKSCWDEFILKVPIVSEFIRYINLSNFMTVLQISYDAGLPIMSGLELSNKTVGNYVMKKRIFDSVSLVRSGKSLTEAFERSQAIPSALMTMIVTGEKSGTLGKMFHDAADVIDKKVDLALEAMMKAFEPTLIVIMGIFVLFIAIGFCQLYYSMLGSLF